MSLGTLLGTGFCNLFTHFLEITGVGVVEVEKVVVVMALLEMADDADDEDDDDMKGVITDDVSNPLDNELLLSDDVIITGDANFLVRQVSLPEVSRA